MQCYQVAVSLHQLLRIQLSWQLQAASRVQPKIKMRGLDGSRPHLAGATARPQVCLHGGSPLLSPLQFSHSLTQDPLTGAPAERADAQFAGGRICCYEMAAHYRSCISRAMGLSSGSGAHWKMRGLNIRGTWTGCCRDCCITDRVTGCKDAREALPSGCCFGATVVRAAKYESKLGAAMGAVTTTTRRSCLTRCTCGTTNFDQNLQRT